MLIPLYVFCSSAMPFSFCHVLFNFSATRKEGLLLWWCPLYILIYRTLALTDRAAALTIRLGPRPKVKPLINFVHLFPNFWTGSTNTKFDWPQFSTSLAFKPPSFRTENTRI